ncbi:MAG: hypothetical protein E7621_02810 [Ruminococcaceae bacterium]|nr:hypothetical protein [Oscillospiraceae bacterium]
MTTGDFFKDTVFSSSNPFALMLCAAITGILFGVFKDVMKIPEKLIGKNSVLIFASDFSGIVCAYLFVFICALHFNHGIIRWYHPVISAVFLFVYKKTVSKAVVWFFDKLCGLVIKILQTVYKLFMYPVNLIKKLLQKLYDRASVFIILFVQKRKYDKKRVKYHKSASTGFNLVPYKKGEHKNNVKKTRSRSNTSHNRAFDSCSIQASNGT